MINVRLVGVALLIAAACLQPGTMHGQEVGEALAADRAADANHSSTRMADGRQWTTENLRLNLPGSYCYADVERNCERYGRLYTWEAAQRGCQALGDGWRLPTDHDWRELAKPFGGAFDDSPDDRGKQAYEALLQGGRSGFDAMLGGGRAADGRYDDLDAHGFYWTSSDSDPAGAWYYNFGRGSQGLYRQSEGEKAMALGVRCVK
jgi:uncharacterized protein (TIGR02145 family)